MLYALLRPLLFRLDGETAHRLTVKAMTLLPSGKPAAEDAALASTVAGLRFPNPVGLAAGFDKDGEVAHKMHRLGFGFTEHGTRTPLPQRSEESRVGRECVRTCRSSGWRDD